MCGARWYPLLLMLLVPGTSFALELRWSSGSTDISYTSATRCTLLVQANSTGSRLPAEWRLLWVADSSAVGFVEMDSTEACLLADAQVFRIDGPVTAADSASNMIVEQLCSLGSSAATVAKQVVDLPASGRGKFKAVALDPSDSSRVLESNEVTYNGGIDEDYPAAVLHASSIHQSLRLQVTVMGSGLRAATSMSIMAPDSSWSLPLTITEQSDGKMTGVASVAALLPACEATVESEAGVLSAARLPADEDPGMMDPQSCSVQYFEDLVEPPPPGHGFTIQPKDFAFARGFIDESSNHYALHLFYTR